MKSSGKLAVATVLALSAAFGLACPVFASNPNDANEVGPGLPRLQRFGEDASSQRLAAAGADWKVTVWDMPGADSTLGAPPTVAQWRPFTGLPRSLAFSPDGRRLAIGHDECEIWDIAEGKVLRRLPGTLVAWSPHGQTLATGGGELYNAARIWDAETGQERAKLIGGHLHELTALVYSPNGRRVLTGSADPAGATEGVIRCWDAKSGEEVFDFSGCVE